MQKKPKKAKSPVKKDIIGRPTKYDAEKVSLLIAAYANAFTVNQACIYAGISKQTYYDWVERYPSFADQMDKAKHTMGMKAKQVVVSAINNNDVKAAKWWLEKKHPDEFGNTSGTTVNVSFNGYAEKQREIYDI